MKKYFDLVLRIAILAIMMVLTWNCMVGPLVLAIAHENWLWLLLYIVSILLAPLVMGIVFAVCYGEPIFENETKEIEEMEDEYKFISIEDFARAIANAPWNTTFDFTFDSREDVERNGEPEGWYGAKMIRIFDEEDGVLCFGYQGGGCTQCVDMYMISDNTYDAPTNAKAIEEQLIKWFKDYPDGSANITEICVEITDDNYGYLMEV